VSAHVLDRLSMYLDGELAASARSEVEAHLRGCAACARHLEELAAVDAAARELPVPAPTGYFDSLPARVRARLPAPRRRAPPVWVWAAAAGLALAALAPVLLRQTTSPVPEGTRTNDEARVAPPPSTATTAPAAPAEAPPAGGARERVLSKESVRTKAAPPAPAPPPVLLERATENAARAPAAPPPPAPQIQKHNGPWAQAPQSAARAEEAGAEKVPVEEAAAGAPKDAQRDAASEGKAEPNQARRGLTNSVPTFAEAPTEETRYRALLARRPASAGEDRQLHDAWRAFAASYPASPRADEARVRALDALLSAYLREGQARDRERLREEAGLYLRRSDAAQAPRVRAILESIH